MRSSTLILSIFSFGLIFVLRTFTLSCKSPSKTSIGLTFRHPLQRGDDPPVYSSGTPEARFLYNTQLHISDIFHRFGRKRRSIVNKRIGATLFRNLPCNLYSHYALCRDGRSPQVVQSSGTFDHWFQENVWALPECINRRNIVC